MTYSKTQLDIIRQFGSKELSEGCLVWDFYNPNIFWYKILEYEVFPCVVNWESEYIKVRSFHRKRETYTYDSRQENDVKQIEYFKKNILWHIPELFPDVARVAKEKVRFLEIKCPHKCYLSISRWDIELELISIPYNPTLPLIDQEESTLVQLLNLFK